MASMSSSFIQSHPHAHPQANEPWPTSARNFRQDIHQQQHQQQQQPPPSLTIDQCLQLMLQINTSVKNGQFNSSLANNIFVLCQQLKQSGPVLEQTHKTDLNRVFVSLRQACCRDSGQLGTPCRLKMMELVELRAMGWRPSLAHSSYYFSRLEQAPEPTSAPPLLPVNPFGFAQSPSFLMPTDLSNAMLPQAPASFYLIPTGGGWTRNVMPAVSAMAPQASNLIPSTPLNVQAQSDIDAVWSRTSSTGNNKQISAGRAKPAKSTGKVQPFRHEITIRNSDSGKIMGVKGRRVAVVEELSKTVISFQKVDPKSKDRTLTITGNSEEAIEYAKRLVEETIRRNVSPNRPDAAGDDEEDDGEKAEDEDEPDLGISIETTKDGILKLSCADPQILQAAQAALSQYLNRAGRSSKMSAQERELRKERRKSMPVPGVTTSTSTTAKEWHAMIEPGSSTNNLTTESRPKMAPTCYSRDDLMRYRSSGANKSETILTILNEKNVAEIMRIEAAN